MQRTYDETVSIRSNEKLLDTVKSNRILFGALIFAVVVLVYFVSLNFIEPSDTEIIVSTDHGNEPELVKEIVVHISGAVKKPGVYKVGSGSRVADIVSKAGGLLTTSNVNWVTKQLNLSLIVDDQQRIYVPFEWEKELGEIGDAEEMNKILDEKQNLSQETENLQNNNLISINTAPKSTLMGLSGIGEVYAQNIIDNRPYPNLKALKQQSDVPESTIEKIVKKISFD